MRAGAKETKDVLARAKKKNETTKVRRRSAMGMAKTIRVNCDEEGPVSAEWMVPKALWMKRHEREVDRRPCASVRLRELSFDETVLRSANNVSVRWHFREEDGKKVSKELLEALELEDLLEKWPGSVEVVRLSETSRRGVRKTL